jgi:hypothetical protein
MLAPRHFCGGVAVVMKSSKRTLRRGMPYDERAIALARRLGIEIPLNPLMLWVEIGKALLPTEPPKPATLNQLWADIGMYLAELREPEFQWGRGRRPGSKSRKPRTLVDAVSQAAIRQRRSRERKRDRKFSGN